MLQPGAVSAETSDEMSGNIGALSLAYVYERTRMGEFTGETPASVRKTLWLFGTAIGRDRDVRRVTKRHVETWLMSGEWAPGTRRVRLAHVRGFFNWCVDKRHVKKNPCDGIRGPRRPRQLPPRAIDQHTVSAVFEHCLDLREELIVSLMVQEGLRCMEVANLELGDIDWRRRSMKVRGKGGHERVLWLTDETWRALGRYLVAFPAAAGPLIRSHRQPHQPITKAWVSRIVNDAMRRAHAPETAHGLRHTAASDMLEHGAHVRTVQYVLGHASLSTTERYLRWLVGELETAMGGRTYRHR